MGRPVRFFSGENIVKVGIYPWNIPPVRTQQTRVFMPIPLKNLTRCPTYRFPENMARSRTFSPSSELQDLGHRPWDCTIELLPGTVTPKGRTYLLSIPEYNVMEVYIEEALNQGFIRPSASPAASGFFFFGDPALITGL